MPKDTTAIETTNADKIFDLPVKLQPGQVNTMSFPQDSISEMHLNANKELQISFTDGSKVQIENFQELVNSAQSCGKDTIIQLSDNTIIYPEELNTQLSRGPATFGTIENGNQVVTLNEPPAGQIVEKTIQPGNEYKMGFDTDATASAAQAGQNLILTFKDGGILVMKNYFSSMNSELPPALTLADGSVVDSTALLTSCKLVETPSFAETVAEETAAAKSAQSSSRESVADTETAAGDESQQVASAARKGDGEAAPDVEPAAGEEDVANIEPAAGTAGGLSGGRGGYGFASEPGAVPFSGLSSIGVIGATSLLYTTPTSRLGPTGLNAPQTTAMVDINPFAAASQVTIDESGMHSISNKVNFNFGSDGPSETVPPVQATGDFDFTGSTGTTLTSHGQAVTVTRTGDTYTGTAGGSTVFTFQVLSDGNYTFTQLRALDHADGTDANDVIVLNFGVVGTDKDGDQAVTSVSVNVLDDAPTAVDDAASVGSAPLTVTGNVLTNDNAGYDASATVTAITFNGNTVAVPAAGNVSIVATYGTLIINSTGAFSYTSNNTALGTDDFTYTMRDFDGDTDMANLALTVTDLNSAPVIGDATSTVDETSFGTTIAVSGAVSSNFFGDTPGTITGNNTFSSGGSKLNNALTSNGVAVGVTQSGGTYTGKAGNDTVFTLVVNSDGTYTYTQFKTLDHADKANPDDVINLNFGIVGTDTDGDNDTGTITINVKDDGPLAVADAANVTATNPTITGNVTANDDFGADGKPVHAVTKIIFNGVTTLVPTDGSNVTVTSANGTLTINQSGQYSYTSTTTTGGSDTFTYVIADKDGDTDTVPATSTLKITVDDTDFIPTITSDVKTIDETNLGPITVTGAVTANYFSDGSAGIAGNNSFSSNGSKLNNALTSNGVAVAVTQTGNVYTGKAGDVTVFTMTVNADGTYSFVLNRPLDHADKSNPDDIIGLNFGVVATDSDGDKSQAGTITINVKDDGPTAVNDSIGVAPNATTVTGNVTANDSFGQDGKPTQAVTKIIFNGTTFTVPADGSNVTVTSANGKLTINQTGAFSYTSTTTTGGVDNFNYVIQDRDGDTDTTATTATLKITVDDIDYVPTITSDAKTIDETNLNPGGTGVSGSVSADFFSDGPGVITAQGASSFSASGSLTGGQLTSLGSPITVTLVNNVYFGNTADGRTIFALTVNDNGIYRFNLNGTIDHADKANPNDAIDLTFGVTATDADGDKANGTIKITVLDDGPVAVNDAANVAPGANTVTGNVTTNDNFGQDGKPVQAVTKIIFNGTTFIVPADGSNITVTSVNGKLTINQTGAYSYTSTTTTGGVDNFGYVIQDRDGDTDTTATTATLRVTIDDVDFTPTVTSDAKTVDETNLGPITVNGSVAANYFSDGPGTITGTGGFSSGGSQLGGNLTSRGVPVVVTQAGNVYTGKAGNETVFTLTVNTDGSYSFTLNTVLDHADKANPNDAIDLVFGIKATDADGDVANGTIKITVLDDGPTAVNDTATLGSGTTTATGNLIANDNFGKDGPAPQAVTKITFNGVTSIVPATGNVTVTGTYGTLVINKDGVYTYTSKGVNGGGVDNFTYTISDKDGDTDTASSQATLTVTVSELDQTPTVTSDVKTVDETNIEPGVIVSVSGAVTADYKGDGSAGITGNGSFSAGGSLLNGGLSYRGQPITVVQEGNVYIGKIANGTPVFTLEIRADGTYTYNQGGALDHANASNPDDIITLNFGVISTDQDGDKSAPGVITINVKDDGPSIGGDTKTVEEAQIATGANVSGQLAIDYGSDGAGSVHANNSFSATGSVLNNTLTSKGVAVVVTQVGDSYVGTAGGVEVFKYTQNANGTYDFKLSRELDHADPRDPHDVITLNFGVRATDFDGDTANSVVKVNVVDDGPVAVPSPSVAICVNNFEDNVFLPTKEYATVISITADGQGQGNQALHLVLSGIDPSWVFTPVQQVGNNYQPINQGVYNAAAKTWTLDLAPGVDFDGKFYFKPTSDTDLNHITFTATVTEGGQSSVQTDDFNIIVNGYDNASGARMASFQADDSHALATDSHAISTATAKSGVNDNLPEYSSVVEADHDMSQAAINNFVYATSSASAVSSSSSTASSESTAHAIAVAPAAAEDLHHVQSQVA